MVLTICHQGNANQSNSQILLATPSEWPSSRAQQHQMRQGCGATGTPALLGGMKRVPATVQDRSVVSYKTKHAPTIQSSNCAA
jgi:hypothetical protein